MCHFHLHFSLPSYYMSFSLYCQIPFRTECQLLHTKRATCKFFSGYWNSVYGVSPELVSLVCVSRGMCYISAVRTTTTAVVCTT
jgi:hypothetical protein